MTRALQYSFSIPNYLKVRAADRLPLRTLASGSIPGLNLIEVESKPLPGNDWVRLSPRYTGICGSDISMLTNRSGPSLMPFVSFPLIPGHEVVAEVTEIGADVTGLAIGQRVVLNPVISCQMRNLEPCRLCASGMPGLCMRTAEGGLSAGMLTGFCKDLPGGWSHEIIAHRSQVVAVPDGIDDRTAAVVEPFSVAVHAVLANPPRQNDTVLIIGSGTIGLLVLAALRMLGHTNSVTVLARHPLQQELAQRFGATNVLKGGKAGDAAVQIAGARAYQPLRGPQVYAGGFDTIYDCVGSNRSVDDSLRVAGPRARVVLVGCAAEMHKLDLTPVWSRELTVSGCYVYGQEHSLPGAPHTFQVALDLIQKHPEIDLSAIVTHVFKLDEWQAAMQVSLSRGKHAALKVLFDLR
ncbi:MAG: alcohol dehydrogenase catalytic domain-containing protein [Thermomicrobiales bacterium]|jgi:threonine dehydrogenase-like Zn-dependent dehydrogenase|nr:alcohol dehydrogenase catalytic domain-containing protein [Thermomicrobiales bacterium]